MDSYSTLVELRKFVTPEIMFGVGARKLVGRYVENLGCGKALFVTDSGVIKTPWFSDVTNKLDEIGFPYLVFSSISPNPRETEVMSGVEIFRSGGCDSIIALGGGSVMDCAKGIGIVSTNNLHILEFEGVDKVENPMPPLICIPTTAGSSADVSQFAIINNTSEKVKIAIISKAVVPDAALIDPEVLITMDNYLTACTAVDALVHAIEAYVSNASSNLTDIHALEAIQLIYSNLLVSLSNPKDIKLRAKIMHASMLAGLAFSNASLGCVHSMAHSMGGFLDLPHGECNALLLPHVMNYNYHSMQYKYEIIGKIFQLNLHGLEDKQKCDMIFKKVFDFRTEAGIKNGLTERGVKSADISVLADKAIKDPCNATNPRTPNKRDLEVIYEEAM
jgi:alcohol dehydrogenase